MGVCDCCGQPTRGKLEGYDMLWQKVCVTCLKRLTREDEARKVPEKDDREKLA